MPLKEQEQSPESAVQRGSRVGVQSFTRTTCSLPITPSDSKPRCIIFVLTHHHPTILCSCQGLGSGQEDASGFGAWDGKWQMSGGQLWKKELGGGGRQYLPRETSYPPAERPV